MNNSSKKRPYPSVAVAARNNDNDNNNNKKPRVPKTKDDNKDNNHKDNNHKDDNMPSLLLLLNSLGNIPDEPYNNDNASSVINVCPGKFCDHDNLSTNVKPIPIRLINRTLNYQIKLQDLLDLGECYHCQLQKTFGSISLERLAKLYDPLTKLKNIIGMKMIKDNFVGQIVYFLQDLEPNPAEMLHTRLEGSPGVGKSLVIDIIAEIYLAMGYLTRNIIKKVKLNDLKAKYVGQTPHLTQQAINSAMGGILVIDEAYALGSNSQQIDNYSMEIINVLNRNLTENAGKFICIIAGYSNQMDKCLFAHNEGLQSRFRFKFVIDAYDADELYEIFALKVSSGKWLFHPNFTLTQRLDFFRAKYKSFKYFGRDMESLLFHTKMAHSNRVFFEPIDNKFKISNQDLSEGYNLFLHHGQDNNNKTDLPDSVKHFYA